MVAITAIGRTLPLSYSDAERLLVAGADFQNQLSMKITA